MSKTDITYIYTLVDPITNEIKYVGKSDNIGIRLVEHIKCMVKKDLKILSNIEVLYNMI